MSRCGARGVLGLLLPLIGGCASIVSGSTQSVSVETPGCEGARCELSNDKGKWFVSSTPGSVSLQRSYNNLQVVCRKGEQASTPVSVASTTKGMAFGNILLGGVIGAGVDVSSGAAYDYPQTISVPLQCGPDAAVAASTAPTAPRLGLRVVRSPAADGPMLLVTEVDADSPAARAGLRVGDLLLRANGSALPEPEALANLVAALREPWELELTLRRDGTDMVLRVAPPPRGAAM